MPNQPTTPSQRAAMGALALAFALLGLFTLRGFLPALAWAAIFAVALWPLYCRALANPSLRPHKVLVAGAFTLAVALVFIVPIGLVGVQLAEEGRHMAAWAKDAQEHGIPEPQALHKLPFGRTQVDGWWQQNLADPGAARALVERMGHGRTSNIGGVVGKQVTRRLTTFVFTLLTLFFLFKEGDTVSTQMRRAATRTFGRHGERVGLQIIASIHGTVTGLVLVGLGEGLVLGIAYAVAGVPHPTVFGALTAVAAMIPFAAPVVFGLAALLLAANGSVAWAIGLFLAGMAVTFISDHFIRPVLIGGATKLPFLWVLLGILGGFEAWGLIGLFVGPAIMAALILLWREWACGGEKEAVLF